MNRVFGCKTTAFIASARKWCSKQSAREVARVDQERRLGSKLHASSETTTELSYKNIKNVSWTSEMSVGRQSKISKMSVGRQKCQLDVSQKYQKCQLDVRNVSWTSKKISKMSVGRQKCQLDVRNIIYSSTAKI